MSSDREGGPTKIWDLGCRDTGSREVPCLSEVEVSGHLPVDLPVDLLP